MKHIRQAVFDTPTVHDSGITRALRFLALVATLAGAAAITACADGTAPRRDCTVQNGTQICFPK